MLIENMLQYFEAKNAKQLPAGSRVAHWAELPALVSGVQGREPVSKSAQLNPYLFTNGGASVKVWAAATGETVFYCLGDPDETIFEPLA